MSTNTNASNGASQKSQIGKKEIRVSEVREAEIIRHIMTYTGNNTTLTADCILYDVGERNRNENGDPAGSNVNVSSTGKQTTEELEKRNSVTLIARDASTLNKDTKNDTKDKKKAEAEDKDKIAEEK